MRRVVHSLLMGCLLGTSCTSFDDASPTKRNSFIHFYSSGTNFRGSLAEIDTDGGYIIAAEINHDNGNQDALIIKTDQAGRKLWETVIKNGIINAIKPHQNGYILLGDRIDVNPSSTIITELRNTQARVIAMNSQGSIQSEFLKGDSVTVNSQSGLVTIQVDYHGSAITFDNNGNLLVLGSFKEPGGNERSFVSAFNTSNGFLPLWTQAFGLLDRDYVNCNSLFVTSSSKLVWASKTFRQIQNLSREYMSIAFVEPNSTFENNSLFGESEETKNHTVEDFQASSNGYAAIGTYSNQNGTGSNIFFIRIDPSGNVIQGSAKYFDGVFASMENQALSDKDENYTEDLGLALTAVDDGYVLACQMESTPGVGEGGSDIMLMKVDPFGKLLWTRIIGGTGSETVSSITSTEDGGLLLCGSNTIGGLSSIMLVKTDKDGLIIN